MVHNLARRRAADPHVTNGPQIPPGTTQGVREEMATDYDAPRKSEEDQSEESIEELKARRHDKNSGKVDEDEAEAAESFELPGADLSHEELAVEVMPASGGRVHLHELLPGPPPQPVGRREEAHLQGLRCVTWLAPLACPRTSLDSLASARSSCRRGSRRRQVVALTRCPSGAAGAAHPWTAGSSWRPCAGPASGPARRTCR